MRFNQVPALAGQGLVAASRSVIFSVFVVLTTFNDAQACSSCGCSLGTDWSDTGLTTASGLKLDLRYDFIDQNQLRAGRSTVQPDAANPPAGLEEIQQGTLSRVYTLSADYAVNAAWGVNVQLPYLQRQHQSLPLDDGNTSEIDTSNLHAIGDLRIVGRYQGWFEDRHLGVQFGLKLPTGSIHQNFATGPDAGSAVDRGLQAGSGTTDLILGVYDHGMFHENWDRFEQLQYKVALNSQEQFRPSPQINANLGLRYVAHPICVPQLQLNFKWEGREIGANGDFDNSGSRVAYLSPGVTLRFAQPMYGYVFMQLPIYQDYTGVQLAPQYTASVGVSYHF